MTTNWITGFPPAASASLPSEPKPIRPEYSAQWNDRIASTAIPRSPTNGGKRGPSRGAAKAGDGAAAAGSPPLTVRSNIRRKV